VTATLNGLALLHNDVEHARRLGFGGKLCIHPKQVDAINRGFAPTDCELAWAKRVLEEVEVSSTGVFQLGGVMVDRPVIE
jgi:citrate lyase subunit beta/citryl-CoA lyase